MNDKEESDKLLQAIRCAAMESTVIANRMSLARFTADVFRDVGTTLHVFGHLIGQDRKSGTSPFGHGDDAAVAVSMLLQIGSQLISGSADLIADGRHYAGAALIRQLVEVEYLAWAFETNDEEAARWLRSSPEERQRFFTPAKLRKAANGQFRGVDYGHHCELGGHPVPGSWRLLRNAEPIAQLMLSDCLGHSGRIWDHIVGWAKNHAAAGIVIPKVDEMLTRYTEWKKVDPLTALPLPPAKAF